MKTSRDICQKLGKRYLTNKKDKYLVYRDTCKNKRDITCSYYRSNFSFLKRDISHAVKLKAGLNPRSVWLSSNIGFFFKKTITKGMEYGKKNYIRRRSSACQLEDVINISFNVYSTKHLICTVK